MTLRIATVQAEATPGDLDANLSRAADWIERAGAQNVDVIVFPEAFTTGYDDAVLSGALPDAADTRWLAAVQRAVDRTGIVAILNTALDRGDRRTLTDVVVTPHRPAVVAYDKQHLYDSERTVFAAGDAGFSFVVNDLRLALSVCYDANFPEHAAAAAAAGADVYVNSGAYFPGGAHRRDLHYAARALDNGMYVVFSGLVGGTNHFIGGSAIFDPTGRRIAAVDDVEGLAIADLDRDEIVRIRDDQRMWADRRAELGPQRTFGPLTGAASAAAE
ncbi:MAG: carbon-nitrogen hydrolase family protein [Microbacterium sp. 71-36]|uniref:carbon-nitrogen hydrolase family protein n=1 Tax=unclassified Microbacterium TaxID=2609290 RepID=UPI00086C74FE|nr:MULTISPECIES: carbon-nitrogen hydrolase family protein [unclassified Microbacterium]MBN9210969.1 carbon-nitrogen hydrolase family protein [Microbacterium sp.]ODT38588.1 MAG: amidohydrolase [Microbacterium sp. SCN 71-17]OJV76839.1 MAG: carbon-nitrogen hydrolase family protein [Microbacterium sp. 71-36]